MYSRFLWCFLLGCGGAHVPLPVADSAALVMPPPPEDAPHTALPGNSVVVRNATLIDGLGGTPQANTDVWVQNGQIHAIGVDLDTPDLPTIDAQGLTLLPGLITSHVHLQSVPGSVIRQDSTEALHAQQALQLRAYVASGFTTVLDPAISVETAQRLRSHVAAGNPGPEILVLAPFVTPAEGYMTSAHMRGDAFEDLWPGITKDTDLNEMFAQAQVIQPVGAKVAIEEGVIFPNFPVFDDDDLDRIRDAGVQAQSPLFVHSITNDAHRRALALEPYALVHVGLWNETIAADVLETLQQRQTYVITTATLHHLAHWGWSSDFVEDAWIQQRVPVVQWQTILHPDTTDHLSKLSAEIMRPSWVPSGLARASASMFIPTDNAVQQATASSVAAIAALHEAGVPWVVGADEGNSPAYTTFFHGVSSQIELEVLDAGGLPREAILQACTRRPAEMLGIADRLGTIEEGKQADLLLVQDNPLEHGMTALRSAQWVIVRGEARTPAAWLVDPQ